LAKQRRTLVVFPVGPHEGRKVLPGPGKLSGEYHNIAQETWPIPPPSPKNMDSPFVNFSFFSISWGGGGGDFLYSRTGKQMIDPVILLNWPEILSGTLNLNGDYTCRPYNIIDGSVWPTLNWQLRRLNSHRI
jgi:hypothetical protein